MVIERNEVSKNDCWNVEDLFPDLGEWQQAFDKISAGKKPRWSQIAALKEDIENPETLKVLFDVYFAIERLLSSLYTYAHLRHDEDIAEEDHKIAYNRICTLMSDFSEETAWIEPTLIAINQKTLDSLLASPILAEYRFHLEKIIRIKKHTRSPEVEEVLARSCKAMQTSHKSFSALNDADFKFGKVENSKKEQLELTHGLYGSYIRSQDRVLRKNSFYAIHNKFAEHENAMCELLHGEIQSHFFNSQTRNYKTCLEAALFPKNIDVQVYHALIKTVNSGIAPLQKYMRLRKKLLGLDKMGLYDLNVPLVKDVDIHMPYEEAENIIIDSVAPLGTEYQELLRNGLKEDRWVDRYENKNKRSGAYSSGSYDSMPYILMNYNGILRDCFTLAHEAGHSMHSLLTHQNQPYHYGSYSIFLAEVASTFNEELLMQELLKRSKNKEEEIFLINQKIEDIRGTLFRQTMFAEFELTLHDHVEKDIPLTPLLLRQIYRDLNKKYYGPAVEIDKEGEIEWARIPHFYYDFYVFQYATGISAALALADRVTSGGDQEREDYLSFLKSGCSKYPIDLLKIAGVDMCSPAPIAAAIGKFSALVDRLELLTSAK